MQSAQLRIIAQASSRNFAALRLFAVRFSRFLLETSKTAFGQFKPIDERQLSHALRSEADKQLSTFLRHSLGQAHKQRLRALKRHVR